ncbi:hypothetical protein Nepgr_010661 [Nepenthes gracilis]|uniref:Fe2OG dioxygenase domain-containing protein n=1 Tax=Nepenthes gracilis TaxID=150966 RepID=A0AAD3XLM3_NEPGR|nr:hypothetical protein Nepgr_010661 [Nepenthes gracilis]
MEAKILSTGFPYRNLPRKYVRPESDRPKLPEVSGYEIVPVVDLGCDDKARLNQQIGDACRRFGVFQVVNHGVEKEAVEEMLRVADEFFKLPVEEKMELYSEDPTRTVRLSTSFNVTKEEIHNWRDYLRLHCWPLHQFLPHWPSNPSSFKEVVSKYVEAVRQLGLRLEEAISESLGLEQDCVKGILGEQGQHMAINYYPPCPEPELTYGLPAHTDPNTLTILLQDSQVCGLQVLHDGKWVAVNPHPHAFVVNIGDQLQALSNGVYKSVWHRAVVNADKPRISVASFLCPDDNALISAPPPLTANRSSPVYRNFTYSEYYKKFWSRNLDQEHCLELFKN